MKKTIFRNTFDALHHILDIECIPALKALSEVCKEEEKITQRIKKWPYTKTGYGNLITLKRALVCLLCIRMANIFEDKRGISFRDLGANFKKFKNNKIIQKMIRTRHTWFGHIGKDVNDIISGQEIVKSDLENQLKNLSASLISLYFHY